MPASDNDRISAEVKLAQGTKLDVTVLTAQHLDSIFREKYSEIDIVSTSAGVGDENSLSAIFSETGNYIINYTFKMKPLKERQRDIFQIADEMRKDIENCRKLKNFMLTREVQEGLLQWVWEEEVTSKLKYTGTILMKPILYPKK